MKKSCYYYLLLLPSIAITRKSTMKKENVSENLPEENFNVTRSDIEKVVADYFYSTHTSAKESGF